jgi:hypothetical protein
MQMKRMRTCRSAGTDGVYWFLALLLLLTVTWAAAALIVCGAVYML